MGLELEKKVKYGGENCIIVGRAQYINGQKMFMLQKEKDYNQNGLYFPTCFWASDEKLTEMNNEKQE